MSNKPMVPFKLADTCIGLISILILACPLAGVDFGSVAMAMAVVTLMQLKGVIDFDGVAFGLVGAGLPSFKHLRCELSAFADTARSIAFIRQMKSGGEPAL